MGLSRFVVAAVLLLATLQVTARQPVAAAGQPPLVPPAPAASAAPLATVDASPVRALIVADRETTLVAPMTGRIEQLSARLGASFRKGQVLVAFDCREHVAREKIATAELKAARENYDAKVRLEGLQAAGEVEVKLAAAAVDKAVGQVELSQAQVGQCAVVAPFVGRVARVHVKQHEVVNVGTPLADIVGSGPRRIRLNVPSQWLKALKTGMPFTITVDETGRSYPATVSAISARVDAAAQTVEIEGSIGAAYPELLPGMSGTAHFPGLN